MAKGYIIVDMPENCGDCKFRDIYDAPYCIGCIITRMMHEGWAKPDWCPIKEIPKKIGLIDEFRNSRFGYRFGYMDGWNDQIDEMFRGDE